jgi:hypothetical protein
MRIRLLLTVVWSVCLFLFALNFIRNDYRWFILPFTVMTPASAILSAVAAVLNSAPLSRTALRVHGLLFLPWMFGQQWKGGDDGPGLAWLFFVGVGCAVAALLAFCGRKSRDQVKCPRCGELTSTGRFATSHGPIPVWSFRLGLLSRALGRRTGTCQHCGYTWST